MPRSAEKFKPVAVAELDSDDAFEGLTSKQHLFVTLCFSGLSDMEAYRQAYSAKDMAYGTMADHARQLMRDPLITAKLKSLVQRRDEQATLASFLSREWITNGIADLARHADKDSTRLNAYVALGKMVGFDMFRETIRHENVTRTVEDVEQQLREKLETLRQTLTIEGNGRQVEPASGKTAAGKDRRRKPRA